MFLYLVKNFLSHLNLLHFSLQMYLYCFHLYLPYLVFGEESLVLNRNSLFTYILFHMPIYIPRNFLFCELSGLAYIFKTLFIGFCSWETWVAAIQIQLFSKLTSSSHQPVAPFPSQLSTWKESLSHCLHFSTSISITVIWLLLLWLIKIARAVSIVTCS